MTYTSENISLLRANTSSTAFASGDINENTVNAYSNLFYPYILDNGGNSLNVSLTIDVLNKKELKQETLDAPDKNWVNEERRKNSLPMSKSIWGFKEAFHGVKKSHSISNAICFAGQRIQFYIAPQGQDTGIINGTWMYCKTSLVVKAYDIVNGTQSTLCTFDDFELDEEDSHRYFYWDIPSISNSFFSQYGLFGLNVIRLEIEQTYYQDAARTVSLSDSIPYKNQSHLQLLIYSGAKEIIEVNSGDINILTSTPSYSETLEQIFNKTVLYNLQSLNQNTLSNAQKRAIIADQIALLFISQHPVITADIYPGKVIGGGAKQAAVIRKVIEKSIVYGRKYPETIPMINDRLFGMLVNYQAFDFITDLNKYLPDYHQSSQILRDPLRVIYMNSDGVIESDLGIDGLIFNPFSMSVLNAETIFVTPDESAIDIKLQDGLVDIQNIQVLDSTGTNLPQPYDTSLRISFGTVFGEDYIKQIRYSVFTVESGNYLSYVDTTGLTRYHIFNLDNPVIPRPAKRGDIVTAQIDIEDIDGGVTSFIYNQPLSGYDERPTLYDFKIYQRNTGDQVVDLYYTYDGLGEINESYLYVQFSSDNGVTWSEMPITSLKGDFGLGVMPGRNHITWKPSIDLSNITANSIMARLTLYDADQTTQQGNSVTGVLVKDLTKPEVFVMRVEE